MASKLTIDLYGLLFACPFFKAESDCPFKKYRQMPYDKAVDVLENLPDEDVNMLIKHHSQCQRNRDLS